jgi:hypothetical protein
MIEKYTLNRRALLRDPELSLPIYPGELPEVCKPGEVAPCSQDGRALLRDPELSLPT